MHFIEGRNYLAGCQRKSARRKGTRIILAKVRGAPQVEWGRAPARSGGAV